MVETANQVDEWLNELIMNVSQVDYYNFLVVQTASCYLQEKTEGDLTNAATSAPLFLLVRLLYCYSF